MKKIIAAVLVLALLAGCKGKKTSLKDDDTVDVADFIEFFEVTKAPVRLADTSLVRNINDSSLIGYKIFTQFIPDSLLAKDFGKAAKPRLYPIGRVMDKNKDIYLFVKAVNGAKRVAYLACFDKDQKYLAAMPLARYGFDKTTSNYGLLDSKFQITTYKESKAPNSVQFKRNVYILNNDAAQFTLIMTEPNEEIIENVINPIDTLQRKHKFAGDYVKDKRNYISVRDGKKVNELIFFVHFEKDNGSCIGELKGNLKLGAKSAARYQEPGNPCALEFDFGANSVTMKEVGGCGTYRDIKCFFDGVYPKKKAPKTSNPARKK